VPAQDPVEVIAHRGGAVDAPENTLEAMDQGLAMGADRLEFDLRSTSDGHLVAMHDGTLVRTTGDAREVAEVALADLDEIEPAQRPPTLEAILGRYGTSTRYSIDMKDPEPPAEERLLDALNRHGVAGLVHVCSFEPACLTRVRELDAALPLVRLYRRATPPIDVLDDLDRFAEIGMGIGRAAELVDAQLVDAARSRDLAVYVYVVNEEAEMERLVDLGVTGLITDVPDRARAFVDGLTTAPR
jgi:glycerophosphoryl diester phosphodiesterase